MRTRIPTSNGSSSSRASSRCNSTGSGTRARRGMSSTCRRTRCTRRGTKGRRTACSLRARTRPTACMEPSVPVYKFDALKKEYVTPKHSQGFGSLVTGEQIEVGLLRYKRGEGAREHAHPQEHVLVVLSGRVRMTIGG